LDPKSIWKKSVARAAQEPANLITGAVSLAASAALWNPLPLILWGLGSTGWLVMASSSGKYAKTVLDEEKQKKMAEAERERETLRQKIEILLFENPVQAWVRAGALPDYLVVYRRLVEIRDKAAKVLRDRSEVEPVTEVGIVQQLNYMLHAYLHFVRERIGYLHILANIRPGGSAPPPPPPPGRRRDQRGALAQESYPVPTRSQLPNVEKRLEEVDDKIEQLKELARKEPATAKTRQWHIGILEKQRELLLECQKRDQCVVAQLGAFLDVFEVILGRVSASQFSATEIASYMGSVVEQIEETERFVESMRPAMDELMGELTPV
jgi:hypothetical protein